MAAVPEAFGFGSQSFNEASRDKGSIRLGPAHCQVVALQVSCGGKGLCVRAAGLMLGHIVAQGGFTQTARTAVDQDNQLLLA